MKMLVVLLLLLAGCAEKSVERFDPNEYRAELEASWREYIIIEDAPSFTIEGCTFVPADPNIDYVAFYGVIDL